MSLLLTFFVVYKSRFIFTRGACVCLIVLLNVDLSLNSLVLLPEYRSIRRQCDSHFGVAR